MKPTKDTFGKEVTANIGLFIRCIISLFVLGWPLIVCILVVVMQPIGENLADKQILELLNYRLLWFIIGVISSMVWGFIIGLPLIKYYLFPSLLEVSIGGPQ